MEKDIGLSREGPHRNAEEGGGGEGRTDCGELSLRNAAVDSKARSAGYEQSLGAVRAEKKKAEKRNAENRR